MNLKPLNDNTIIIKRTDVKLKTSKINKKNSLIPNGMQKIIRNEKLKQFLLFSIMSLISFLIIGYIFTLAFIYKTSWPAYIIPLVSISLSLYKWVKTFFEWKTLNFNLKEYEDNLKLDSKYMPPFITDIYKNSIKNQIYHNWFTFTLLFYGIILTFLIWLLKDLSWWILDFKYFIKKLIINPDMWIKIFSAILILILVLHLLFAIQRNKKKQDIKSFFGKEIFSLTNEQILKKDRNKTLRRLFLLKLMIITIIPIFIFIILKRRKRK